MGLLGNVLLSTGKNLLASGVSSFIGSAAKISQVDYSEIKTSTGRAVRTRAKAKVEALHKVAEAAQVTGTTGDRAEQTMIFRQAR